MQSFLLIYYFYKHHLLILKYRVIIVNRIFIYFWRQYGKIFADRQNSKYTRL